MISRKIEFWIFTVIFIIISIFSSVIVNDINVTRAPIKMIVLLNILAFAITILITVLIFTVYYRIFVVGYVKRMKIAFDNNIEKAKKMKQIALKKQPMKMMRLFIKFNIPREDLLKDFEIVWDGKDEGQSLFSLEFQLNRMDYASHILWANPKKKTSIFKVLLIVFLGLIIVNSAFKSFESAMVSISMFVAFILFLLIQINSYYISGTQKPVKLFFYDDCFILFMKDNAYCVKRDGIARIDKTKRSVYIVLKKNQVFIIPKRSIPQKDYNAFLEYTRYLKPNEIWRDTSNRSLRNGPF